MEFVFFLVIVLFVFGLLLLLAPIKLYSIDHRLREILEELRALRITLAPKP